jgi:hypothetical protein
VVVPIQDWQTLPDALKDLNAIRKLETHQVKVGLKTTNSLGAGEYFLVEQHPEEVIADLAGEVHLV